MYVGEIVDVNILNCGYSKELWTIMFIGDVHLNICISNVHSSWKITLKLIYDMGHHAHYSISYKTCPLAQFLWNKYSCVHFIIQTLEKGKDVSFI
jgi:hypothetical protein